MPATNRLGTVEKYGLGAVALVVLAGLHAITLHNYLVFHTIVEVFSIVVACGIFMLAWNSRDIGRNGYLLFLGTAYLFIGGLDLVHTLAYEGLGIFPDHNTDLATQLWIGARYMESLTLLAAPLLVKKQLRAGFVFAGFALVTALVLAGTLYWRIFPVCFEPGIGLTPFKKASEYVIAGILLASVVLLLRRRAAFDRRVLHMLVASVLLTVCSELCFTLYRDAYDVANEAGHLLKLASFYLIYRAVIETGIRQPYAMLLRDLKQSHDVLASKNQELQRLTSIIRHDLGNSLFSVEAFAKCIDTLCADARLTLEDEPLVQERRAQVESILANDIPHSVDSIRAGVSLMRKLLEGLRQVATVGHRPMHVVDVEMNGLIEEVGQALAPKLAAQGACLRIGNVPACAGDQVQLHELFSNLLDNAIKYLDPRRKGEIRVSGRREEGMSVYCVEDNGIGIAPDQQARVFDIFQRVHPSAEVEGDGIGLSIVQRVVERHGGWIELESEPGRGSCFQVTLPAAVSASGRTHSAACG